MGFGKQSYAIDFLVSEISTVYEGLIFANIHGFTHANIFLIVNLALILWSVEWHSNKYVSILNYCRNLFEEAVGSEDWAL